MKAERRHELKTNTLASTLTNFPEFMRVYGGKLLMGVVVVLLVIVLIRYRMTTAAQARQAATYNLATARASIDQISEMSGQLIQMLMFSPSNASQDVYAKQRDQLRADAEGALENINDSTDDPTLRAESLAAKGDLYWALSSFPKLPAATTRPDLELAQKPDELLKVAEQAYQDVVAAYGEQKITLADALFGLAAIAENREKWDEAQKHYDTITADAKIPQSLRQLAEARKTKLVDLRKPIRMGTPATQPADLLAPYLENPTTMPATTSPATVLPEIEQSTPTTAPATPTPASTQPATTAPAVP